MKPKILLHISIWIACLFLMGGWGCNSKDRYIGTYQSVKSGPEAKSATVIELNQNGEGLWKRLDEEVPFSWYIKGEEIRINTKDGGIMVGKLKKNEIIMILPGEEEMTFKKIG